MKSVLIIDTPANCKECLVNKCDMWVDEDERPKDCPLKELLQKRPCNYLTSEGYNNGYDKGWNDYYDHITGDWNNYKPEKYNE